MSVPALPAELWGLGEGGQGCLPHRTPTLLLEASLLYVEKLPELPVSPRLTSLGGTWRVETTPPTNQCGHGPLRPLCGVVAEHGGWGVIQNVLATQVYTPMVLCCGLVCKEFLPFANLGLAQSF